MSEVALITDIHWGARGDSQYFLEQCVRFYDEVFFPTLKERGIKKCIIMGDTWENRTSLRILTLHKAIKHFFDRFAELDIQVYIIYGNHDVFYKNVNDVNSIDFLGQMYSNMHVVKTHEVINFDGLDIALISWVNNTNLQDSLEFIRTAPASILCGHFEIKSFELQRGVACEHGFDKNIFNRYEAVYSGHFHVMNSDGRIEYISNPFWTNWSDYGQAKGFRILDTETKALELIENPFEVYGKIAYTDDVDLMSYDFAQWHNMIVRVYIQAFAQSNQHKLNLFVEKLNQHAHAVDVFEMDEALTGSMSDDSDVDFTDTSAVIEEYINNVVDGDLVDKGRLLTMFMGLYDEAAQFVETE